MKQTEMVDVDLDSCWKHQGTPDAQTDIYFQNVVIQSEYDGC